jgi:pimeloyl-ACP methyl ester carboxylesterase
MLADGLRVDGPAVIRVRRVRYRTLLRRRESSPTFLRSQANMTVGADRSVTLHLPRILCLHGGGTNANIFRMQCRVLARMLQPYFRLVFAEAPLAALPGSDVTAAYKDYGPFKAWLRVRDEDPVLDAHHIVSKIEDSLKAARITDDCRGATGEWVGLLGFSQGAHLAASILANQQELGRRAGDDAARPVYRFGVLLAGRGPLRWLHPDLPIPPGFVDVSKCTTGMEREYEPFVNSSPYRLQIPTIHVHGLADPNIELHRKLHDQYCDPRSTILLEWGGDHRVPIKARDVTPIVQQIIAVARQEGVL